MDDAGESPKPQKPSTLIELYREIDRLLPEFDESQRAPERLKRENA